MTIAPSTIMPKSIAPRLMRFALMPKARMPRKLMSMERGMTAAVMIAARTLPEKEQQDGRDQQETLEEVLLYGRNRAVDDECLVVERHQLDSLRQVHRRNLLFDRFDHALSVLAFEHDHHAGDGFSIAQNGSLSRSRANRDVRNILEQHRRALIRHQDDVAEVLRSGGPSAPRRVYCSEACSM